MAGRLNRRAGGPGWRRFGLGALVLAVTALHGLVAQQLPDRIGSAEPAMPARIEVAYVNELAPAAPPVIAPRPVPVAPPRRHVAAARPARPASAPKTSDADAIAKLRPGPDNDAPTAAAADTPASTAAVAEAAAAGEHRAAADDELSIALSPELQLAGAMSASAAGAATGTSAERVDRGAAAASSATVGEAVAVVAAPGASAAVGAATPGDAAGAIVTTSSASEPAGSSFVWPASTRVSYTLTGNYRGEVRGDAQVEWVHVGSRYQVHLDLTIGPSFAPLISRRMSSDGALTPEGLAPARFDQETKLMFHDRRRVSLRFEPDAVVLADGQRRERVPGVQDSASQFVQLTYWFTTRPELLRVGGSVEVPLALPRKLDRWTYDVLGEEVLQTPFGPLSAFHLKPRRVPHKGGDLVSEIWFAPELRYLPVRIRIRQDEQTFIDLLIDRKPQLAAS